jgi:hypothetical protein
MNSMLRATGFLFVSLVAGGVHGQIPATPARWAERQSKANLRLASLVRLKSSRPVEAEVRI